ncbi:MAG: Crp/Fnr family transcriptional regulator [Bacteroidota bacterium]
MEAFITHLDQQIPLNESDRVLIHQHLRVEKFPKGSFLLREGQISQSFFYNVEGFVRLFYNQDGNEKTAYFFPPGTFISAYESFIYQKPANLSLQTIEASRVIRISREAAQALLSHSPKFDQLARWAMENELISYQKMVANLLRWTPEQRYAQLLQKEPELFARVPQQYIASFIGVSPETLSRIKKRWHTKKT